MPQHPITSLISRLWRGSRPSDAGDDGDLGTAFGMEMSLLRESELNLAPAQQPQPGTRWFRRRGRIATTQARS